MNDTDIAIYVDETSSGDFEIRMRTKHLHHALMRELTAKLPHEALTVVTDKVDHVLENLSEPIQEDLTASKILFKITLPSIVTAKVFGNLCKVEEITIYDKPLALESFGDS